MIGTPARNAVNNAKIRASISGRLLTNMADTPPEAAKHADSAKSECFRVSSTHLDRGFLLSGSDFRSVQIHPVLTCPL
jgi:hypothetical protein